MIISVFRVRLSGREMTASSFDADNMRLVYKPAKDPRVYMESRSNGKALLGTSANGKQRQSNMVRLVKHLKS
jgi:hypothetical protein